MFGFLKKLFGPGVDVKALLDQGAIILDVRTKEEFKRDHVKGAINMPLNTVHRNIKKIKKYNKPIITCCVSGRRSGVAASQLQDFGIDAHNGGPWHRVKQAASN